MHFSKEYNDDWLDLAGINNNISSLTGPSSNNSSGTLLKPKRYKNRGKNKSGTSHETTKNPLLRAIEGPLRETFKLSVPKKVIKETSILGLDNNAKNMATNNIVEYRTLDTYSQKFREIQVLFPSNLVILKIEQVFNPFLRLSFQLKRNFTYFNIQPKKLFHGTKLKYVHSICTYNFNWRFNGAEKGHRHGHGVNFTPKPKFAMNFCDKNNDVKVVILADVLIINKEVGNENVQIPSEGCDTTFRADNAALVKYCDGEFYPSYVIFFRAKVGSTQVRRY